MAFTAVYGNNIAAGSIALRQSRGSAEEDNAIGVGRYSYQSGGYQDLISRYKFQVSTACSGVTLQLAYTGQRSGQIGNIISDDRPFYAYLSSSPTEWNDKPSLPQTNEAHFIEGETTGSYTDYDITFTVEAQLEPGTDYYLFIYTTFTGSTLATWGAMGVYSQSSRSYGDLEATISAQTSGLAHIDNGSSFEDYAIWIDNGTAFEQYVPYIDNGATWELYG